MKLSTLPTYIDCFGLLAFALGVFAYATEALVGEAIGKMMRACCVVVIRRTSLLAHGLALAITSILWIADRHIIALLTTQINLVSKTAQ